LNLYYIFLADSKEKQMPEELSKKKRKKVLKIFQKDKTEKLPDGT